MTNFQYDDAYGDGYSAGKEKARLEIMWRLEEDQDAHARDCGC